MDEKLWLTPAEAMPILGYEKPDALYRDIRKGQFPFKFVKLGRRIKICARSIGAVPKAPESETQNQDQSLATAA